MIESLSRSETDIRREIVQVAQHGACESRWTGQPLP
jgi:hypothetical protein